MFIKWLTEVSASDKVEIGGKGANLGECVQAGFSVPPGFCVTTRAYRESTEQYADELPLLAVTAPDQAQQLVRETAVPEVIVEAIEAAYSRLGRPAVAVRSSATAEDLEGASFAGQQDTYLGVTGSAQVVSAVRQCWASLWNRRAVEYRARQGVSSHGLALAVIVQEMIEPDTAGVLFTKDPVSGSDGKMLVTASFGLGESVVGSLVTGDTYELQRRPPKILTSTIGDKPTRIDSSKDGGTSQQKVSEELRSSSCLRDEQLFELVSLGEKVLSHYGTHQDIEWGFVKEELYLLQSRPITASAPATHDYGHGVPRNRIERALRDDIIEHFPAPYPLDMWPVREVQGRVQEFQRQAGLECADVAELIVSDEMGVAEVHARSPRPSFKTLWALPAIGIKSVRSDPSNWAEKREIEEAALREMRTQLANERGDAIETVLEVMKKAVSQAAELTAYRFEFYLAPMVIQRMLCDVLIRFSGHHDKFSVEDVYSQVDYVTAQIDEHISDLAHLVRGTQLGDDLMNSRSGELLKTLQRGDKNAGIMGALQTFLEKYGARTARMYLPFSNRSWREDPEPLLLLVATSARGSSGRRTGPPPNLELVQSSLPRLLTGFWLRTVKKLQDMHMGRESSLYLIEEYFCLARACMDRVASQLVTIGVLDEENDIKYLFIDEVLGAVRDGGNADVCKILSERKRWRPTAESVWWDRGVQQSGEIIRGIQASAGRVAATARIIRGPEEFSKLQEGEILVCSYTDPTWTPLFTLASAVVADTGGPLSHAAIVAREYGIPAVLGTNVGTAAIEDGSEITVDGSAGTVTLTKSEYH